MVTIQDKEIILKHERTKAYSKPAFFHVFSTFRQLLDNLLIFGSIGPHEQMERPKSAFDSVKLDILT